MFLPLQISNYQFNLSPQQHLHTLLRTHNQDEDEDRSLIHLRDEDEEGARIYTDPQKLSKSRKWWSKAYNALHQTPITYERFEFINLLDGCQFITSLHPKLCAWSTQITTPFMNVYLTPTLTQYLWVWLPIRGDYVLDNQGEESGWCVKWMISTYLSSLFNMTNRFILDKIWEMNDIASSWMKLCDEF